MEKKIILFGCGQTGKEALELIGNEKVRFFVDNAEKYERINRKYNVEVISFHQYKAIYKDYITIITANKRNTLQIGRQLSKNGIDTFLYLEDVIRIFNEDRNSDIGSGREDIIRNSWKKEALSAIKEEIALKQDLNSEVEFYLVDSFEISHFVPIYMALREKGIRAQFVAEPQAINSSGRWFDREQAINILQEEKVEYSTLRNPDAKVAFTTQFAENLRFYHGIKCQMTYGTAIMKEKAFQLKKEVAEKFDYVFVHGDLQKEIIAQWLPSSHIIDMSYPRYWNRFSVKTDRKKTLEELNIRTDKPIVVYYPTWDEYSSILEYENSLNLLRKTFFLISKPHHCLWRYKERLDALYRCSDLVLEGSYDLHRIAGITDCAICDAKSGVVTELAFLAPEMPMVLIYCNAKGKDFYIDLDEFAEGIMDPSELESIVKLTIKYDRKIEIRREITRKMYSSDIRGGIDRCIAVISRLIEK